MARKNIFYLLCSIAFSFSLVSCKKGIPDDTERPRLPFNIVGEWYLKAYFHYPENSEYSYLYTTVPGVGGYYYPTSTIKGDLHIIDDENFTLDLQVVFRRDSLPLLKINKNLIGTYYESHVEEPLHYKGDITFVTSDEELNFRFSILSQFEDASISLIGYVEDQEVNMDFHPK